MHERVKIGTLKNIKNFPEEKPALEILLNEAAIHQALLKRDSITGVFLWSLWNFQEHSDQSFWKFEKCLCSTNFYPRTKQHCPQSNFAKFFAFSYSKKMCWEWGWQLKSCLHLVYFHSCSFATDMANICPWICSLVMFC